MITRVSNEQIVREGNRFSRALDAAGVETRGVVAALLPNVPEFLYAYRGAGWSGRVWTPISAHWSADEVCYVVEDSGAQAFIAHVEFSETAEAAAKYVPEQGRFCVGGAIPGFRPFEEIGSFDDADLESPLAGETMLYTSGTTGRPKGVMRPHAADQPPPGATGQAGKMMLTMFAGEAASGPHLVAAPLYHAGPNTYCEGAVLLGADIVLLDRWNEGEFLRAVQQESVVSTFLVPTHFVRLLRLPEATRQQTDTSSLALVIHGAAPVSIPVKREMIEWLGPILFEFYGGTEGGGVGIGSEDWLAHPGSVGRPNPGLELSILDADGAPCPTGSQGEVFFRADQKFKYKGDPEKTAANRRGDWFTLGDIGYVDEEGYLYLCDRRADVIISGGVNIYPAQIEGALLGHPQVADCCVIGIPDPEWGETVHAVVHMEAGGSLDADSLRSFCRDHLAGYQIPRSVEFVDELPRTDTGKLARRLIRDQVRGTTP